MCNCILSWLRDPSVDGSHNKVPVTCSQYTEALEHALAQVLYAVGGDSKLAERTLKVLEDTGFEAVLHVKAKGS